MAFKRRSKRKKKSRHKHHTTKTTNHCFANSPKTSVPCDDGAAMVAAATTMTMSPQCVIVLLKPKFFYCSVLTTYPNSHTAQKPSSSTVVVGKPASPTTSGNEKHLKRRNFHWESVYPIAPSPLAAAAAATYGLHFSAATLTCMGWLVGSECNINSLERNSPRSKSGIGSI